MLITIKKTKKSETKVFKSNENCSLCGNISVHISYLTIEKKKDD